MHLPAASGGVSRGLRLTIGKPPKGQGIRPVEIKTKAFTADHKKVTSYQEVALSVRMQAPLKNHCPQTRQNHAFSRLYDWTEPRFFAIIIFNFFIIGCTGRDAKFL
jgi:hypothetical protein